MPEQSPSRSPTPRPSPETTDKMESVQTGQANLYSSEEGLGHLPGPPAVSLAPPATPVAPSTAFFGPPAPIAPPSAGDTDTEDAVVYGPKNRTNALRRRKRDGSDGALRELREKHERNVRQRVDRKGKETGVAGDRAAKSVLGDSLNTNYD